MSVEQMGGVCNLPVERQGSAAGCGFHLLKLACPHVGGGGDLKPRVRGGKEPWESHWTLEGNRSSGKLTFVTGNVAPRSLGRKAVSSCCCRWPCCDHS